MLQINFVREVSAYKNTLDSLIDPIRKYLSESTVTPEGRSGALNFCFFIGSKAPSPRVLMSHGVADKNYIGGKSRGNAHKFDYLFVPGPDYKDKHVRGFIAQDWDKTDYIHENKGYPTENIFVVGWPKLDPIFNGEYTKKPSDKIRILYAPTHNAIKAVSSFPDFNQYLNKFPADIEVINSPHPARKDDRMPTMQPLVDADIVIADAGSTIYEAWMLGKPVIFPDWLVKEGVMRRFKGSFEAQIYERELGYHAKDFKHLLELIPAAYEKGVDDEVLEFMEGVCPSYTYGESGKIIADALREIIERG
jgi:hypothetical protein